MLVNKCPILAGERYLAYAYVSGPDLDSFGTLSRGYEFTHVFDNVFIRVAWYLGVPHMGGTSVDYYRVFMNGTMVQQSGFISTDDETMYLDVLCVLGRIYDVQVLPRNAIGWAQTLNTPARILCAEQPSKPLNLRISTNAALRTPTTLPLQWDPPVSDGGSPIVAYRVYKTIGTAEALVYDDAFNAYGDRSIDAIVVRYRISSVSAFGESVKTDPLTVELTAVPRAPPRVNVTRGGLDQVTLRWEVPNDGGSGVLAYEVVKDSKLVIFPLQNEFLSEPYVLDLSPETVRVSFKVRYTVGSYYVLVRPSRKIGPGALQMAEGSLSTPEELLELFRFQNVIALENANYTDKQEEWEFVGSKTFVNCLTNGTVIKHHEQIDDWNATTTALADFQAPRLNTPSTVDVVLEGCDFIQGIEYELHIVLTDALDYTTATIKKYPLFVRNLVFTGSPVGVSNGFMQMPELKSGVEPSADGFSIRTKFLKTATVWVNVAPAYTAPSVSPLTIKTFDFHVGRDWSCFGDHMPRKFIQKYYAAYWNTTSETAEVMVTTKMPKAAEKTRNPSYFVWNTVDLAGCDLAIGVEHVVFMYIEDETAYEELTNTGTIKKKNVRGQFYRLPETIRVPTARNSFDYFPRYLETLKQGVDIRVQISPSAPGKLWMWPMLTTYPTLPTNTPSHFPLTRIKEIEPTYTFSATYGLASYKPDCSIRNMDVEAGEQIIELKDCGLNTGLTYYLYAYLERRDQAGSLVMDGYLTPGIPLLLAPAYRSNWFSSLPVIEGTSANSMGLTFTFSAAQPAGRVWAIIVSEEKAKTLNSIDWMSINTESDTTGKIGPASCQIIGQNITDAVTTLDLTGCDLPPGRDYRLAAMLAAHEEVLGAATTTATAYREMANFFVQERSVYFLRDPYIDSRVLNPKISSALKSTPGSVPGYIAYDQKDDINATLRRVGLVDAYQVHEGRITEDGFEVQFAVNASATAYAFLTSEETYQKNLATVSDATLKDYVKSTFDPNPLQVAQFGNYTIPTLGPIETCRYGPLLFPDATPPGELEQLAFKGCNTTFGTLYRFFMYIEGEAESLGSFMRGAPLAVARARKKTISFFVSDPIVIVMSKGSGNTNRGLVGPVAAENVYYVNTRGVNVSTSVAVSYEQTYKVLFTLETTSRTWVHVSRRAQHELYYLDRNLLDAISFEALTRGEKQAGGVNCRVEQQLAYYGASEFELSCPELGFGLYEVRVAVQDVTDLERPGRIGFAGLISVPYQPPAVDPINLQFTDRFLYPYYGVHHRYQVRGVNRLGVGVLSLPTVPILSAGPPPPPFVTIANRTMSQISLVWGEPYDNGAMIQNYALYRDDVRVFFGAARAFTDANVKGGTTYNYRISAWNQAGQGPISDAYSVPACRLPNKPINYKIRHSYAGFHLTWQRPPENSCQVRSFIVELDGMEVGKVASFGSKNTHFKFTVAASDNNMVLGKVYALSLASESDGGRSAVLSPEIFIAPLVVGQNSLGIKEQKEGAVVLEFHVEDDGYGHLYPELKTVLPSEKPVVKGTNDVAFGELVPSSAGLAYAGSRDVPKLPDTEKETSEVESGTVAKAKDDSVEKSATAAKEQSYITVENLLKNLTFHAVESRGGSVLYNTKVIVSELGFQQDIEDRLRYVENESVRQLRTNLAKRQLTFRQLRYNSAADGTSLTDAANAQTRMNRGGWDPRIPYDNPNLNFAPDVYAPDYFPYTTENPNESTNKTVLRKADPNERYENAMSDEDGLVNFEDYTNNLDILGPEEDFDPQGLSKGLGRGNWEAHPAGLDLIEDTVAAAIDATERNLNPENWYREGVNAFAVPELSDLGARPDTVDNDAHPTGVFFGAGKEHKVETLPVLADKILRPVPRSHYKLWAKKLIRVTVEIQGLDPQRRYCFRVFGTNKVIAHDRIYSPRICAVAAPAPRLAYADLDSGTVANEFLVRFPTAVSGHDMAGYQVLGFYRERGTDLLRSTTTFVPPDARHAKLQCNYGQRAYDRVIVRGVSAVTGSGQPQVFTNVTCAATPLVHPPRVFTSKTIHNNGKPYCQLTVDYTPATDYGNPVSEYQLYIRKHGSSEPYRLVGIATARPNQKQLEALLLAEAAEQDTVLLPNVTGLTAMGLLPGKLFPNGTVVHPLAEDNKTALEKYQGCVSVVRNNKKARETCAAKTAAELLVRKEVSQYWYQFGSSFASGTAVADYLLRTTPAVFVYDSRTGLSRPEEPGENAGAHGKGQMGEKFENPSHPIRMGRDNQ